MSGSIAYYGKLPKRKPDIIIKESEDYCGVRIWIEELITENYVNNASTCAKKFSSIEDIFNQFMHDEEDKDACDAISAYLLEKEVFND